MDRHRGRQWQETDPARAPFDALPLARRDGLESGPNGEDGKFRQPSPAFAMRLAVVTMLSRRH